MAHRSLTWCLTATPQVVRRAALLATSTRLTPHNSGLSWSRKFQTTAFRSERFRNNELSSSLDKSVLTPESSRTNDAFSKFGFAFDIDGVLYQGKQQISGAGQLLRKLRSNDVRYVFLTNGGGTRESSKAISLAKRLGLAEDEDVVKDRIILSHTPMQDWDDFMMRKGTVLITGSYPEMARQIAKEYGFERVVTPADILEANPHIYPFAHLRESLHSVSSPLPDGKRLNRLEDPYSQDLPVDSLKIDQILVWNDPRDWSLDTQLIIDLLTSHKGYLGTISSKNGDTSLPNNGWQQDGQPAIWISNLDLVWRTEYPMNRFGTGAFVEALKGVWSAATGGTTLQYNALGKPMKATYDYAHERLLNYYSDLGVGQRKPLRRVYMIGDNPESDIRGANEFEPQDGTEWVSILVKTGVWKETTAMKEPSHRPAVIVDDVVDAIVWAMRNEGLKEVDRSWVLGGEAQP